MIINKRTKRIFFEHKAFYIGMILLIIFSTSLFLSMKTATTSIKKSVEEDRINSKIEDANFTFSRKLTTKEISKFQKKYNFILQESRYKEVAYNNAIVRVRSVNQKLNLHSVYSGKDLNKSSDILVDRFFFNAQKLSFGDKLALNDIQFNVSGILAVPDYLAMLKEETDYMTNGSKFGLVVVGEDAYKSVIGNEKLFYSVKFNESSVMEFRKELSQLGLIVGWTDINNNMRIAAFNGEIDAIIKVSELAPLFIMLVSCIIMAVVMGRMLKKEYCYIGTLISMGYKKVEILSHYLRLPIIISFVGSISGLGLGYILTEPMEIISKAEYSIPAVKLDFKWENVLFVLLLPLILNVLAATFSIFRALNLNIVALLKANSNQQKKGLLSKIVPYKRGSFRLRFKLKEILCNIPRSALMLIGIVVASLFILSGFILDSSINFLFDNSFDKIYKYNYQYIYTTPKFESPLKGEPFMLSSFEYAKDGKKNSITLNGIEENSKYIILTDDNGKSISKDKIVMAKSVAKKLKISKGESIIIKSLSNLKEYNITIDDIANISVGNSIYISRANLNKMLSIPDSTYIGLFSDKKLDVNKSDIKVESTKSEGRAGMESSINAFKAFLYVMAAFAAIIGVIVIYIVTIMLVEENRKNISMLKVIGYHQREISRILINSTSLLVWFGFIIAIPFSKGIMQSFFNKLTANMYFAFEPQLEANQIFAGFLFILLIYYITLFICKKRVLNINMVESLKARE
ncbi:MAG: FtsX-like permease family protein [Clostridium sp.]|uniref:ABC transporter permease n=1 Tax=Clostridium sp. TaxID=1506 RepID=UPI003D6D99A6